jgi:hypothetical protein
MNSVLKAFILFFLVTTLKLMEFITVSICIKEHFCQLKQILSIIGFVRFNFIPFQTNFIYNSKFIIIMNYCDLLTQFIGVCLFFN